MAQVRGRDGALKTARRRTATFGLAHLFTRVESGNLERGARKMKFSHLPRLALVTAFALSARRADAQDTTSAGMAPTAQDTTGAQKAPLTLNEAIELARQNNPTFLQTLNDLGPADWGVRSATASLLLPQASVGFGAGWQDQGEQRLGAVTFPQPPVLLSQYSISLSYQLDGSTLFQPGQRRAERRAVERRIDDAEMRLRNSVTSAYIEVLRLQDRAEQSQRELHRSEEHLRLAQAREQVGTGTRLETMQAEVAQGQARVNLVQARNAARVAKLRLVQALGVELPPDQVDLVSQFPVFQPNWDVQNLVQDALSRHPSLVALRAQRQAANAQVKVARSTYFPSLSLSARWSGFTREETNPDVSIARQASSARSNAFFEQQSCQQLAQLYDATNVTAPPPFNDCSVLAFTSQDSAQLAQQFRQQNNKFPFSFQNEPLTLSAFVSLPIFSGFNRQLQVEQATSQRSDLDHQIRGLELQVRADVTEAYANLETAYQTVQLQKENTQRANEERRLARERYQLGAGTFLELLDSETLAAQADVDQIEAVYGFHQALTALEAALGRPLQTPTGDNQ